MSVNLAELVKFDIKPGWLVTWTRCFQKLRIGDSCDIEGSQSSGSEPSDDSAPQLTRGWASEVPWYNKVPSASNPGDDPSRLKMDELRRAGAREDHVTRKVWEAMLV